MPRQVDVAARHEEFVRASLATIADLGLAGATLRRVAERAGCTTGALTHYFPNRNRLLVDTLAYVHVQAGQRMMAVLERQELNDGQKLRAVLLESLPLDVARLQEWRVWLAFWSAAMDDADLAQENRRRYVQWTALVRELLTPLVAKPRVEIETSRLIALVDGLGVGLVRQKIAGNQLASVRDEVAAVLERHLSELSI
ncbi:MAG: TetR family transcriptional regulator C-terminal domain-containing protein [Pseudomonadota bacterium]